MSILRILISTLAGLLWLATSGLAGYVTVDLPIYNGTIQDRILPLPDGDVVLGGVPFHIPSGPNEYRTAAETGGYFGGENLDSATDGVYTLDIPVGITGVSTVYSLASEYWGRSGVSYMSLEFFGSGGAYYRRDLVGDSDIRDWNAFPAWTTTINGVTAIEVFVNPDGRDNNPDYVDMQIIKLPLAFASQELISIRLTDQRTVFVHSGILSGITVASTPEPATGLMILGGLAVVAMGKVRRNSAK